MPRREQRSGGDLVYHVLNRAAKRSLLFAADADYFALEGVMDEARKRTPIDLLAYCIMPNHWHFILLPESGQQMSQFMHWLTLTHAHRWQIFHQTIGTGAVYQGRYKAIPIQTDSHFLNVCRYVERNPLRAGLVERAQDWRWSSLWRRHNGLDESLSPWPVSRPSNWTSIVNGVENDRDLGEIRLAVRRGAPFGDPDWTLKTAGILGLESKLRPRGRPKKDPDLFSGHGV
jgi:REP-associated tyrosine transposase